MEIFFQLVIPIFLRNILLIITRWIFEFDVLKSKFKQVVFQLFLFKYFILGSHINYLIFIDTLIIVSL